MADAPPLRLLVVDDEPLARRRLRDLLQTRADVLIVGECENGPSALEAIRRLAPAAVLLDIQMPGLDGIGVAEALPHPRPAIVFVTAYDQHAIRAFEVHAMDYVLKPFEPERLFDAIDHLQRSLREPARDPADWRQMLTEFRRAPTWIDRVAIRLGDKIYYVRLDEVDWIEAEGNYARLHTGAKSHLLRRAMRQLVEDLDPRRFARIHRSAIVNIDRVAELRAMPEGDFMVQLTTGTRLKMLRRYRDGLP